jgi:hypothetical protein|tara:strand:- start:636 stop:896 length:261 start_codon:yes stop_codon:yes gene_type:complete
MIEYYEYNKSRDWESWSKKFNDAVENLPSVDSILIACMADDAKGRGLEGDAFIAKSYDSIMNCIESEGLADADGYKELYKIHPTNK